MSKLICTPWAKIELQRLTQNIESFQKMLAAKHMQVRPHIKTHKSSAIARMQLKAGASGITVSRLHEAREMIKKGIFDIFVAYPIVGSASIEAYQDLLRPEVRVSSAFDSLFHLRELKRAAQNCGKMNIRLEVDSGQHRCGCIPELKAIKPLAEFIKKNSNYFQLEGVFSHAGQAYACANSEQIKAVAHDEQHAVCKAARILENLDLSCRIISVGSTPTAPFIQPGTQPGAINECRPGNYVFFDAMQIANQTANARQCSLTVVSTVIATYQDRVVIDAGSKALGLDKGAHGLSLGYGVIVGHEDLVIDSLSEEHGIVKAENTALNLKAGQIIEIIPNHSCAAANMFSEYQVFKNNSFFATWPLEARR
jgi:D-serine deaminase-like pyridoxal phosphate-dependent protein